LISQTYIQTLININNIIQISTGSFHTLLLNNNNQIFSFGSNLYGQLGLNLQFGLKIYFPTPINLNLKINQVSCGLYHCLVLINTGQVYSFGRNNVHYFLLYSLDSWDWGI
jgi:alpha-tubulin suppressor-like RCC1 family protein